MSKKPIFRWFSKKDNKKNVYEVNISVTPPEFDEIDNEEPNNAEYWLKMGSLYEHQRRFHDALKCYDKMLEMKGLDGTVSRCKVWNFKGICNSRLRNYGESIACFERAIEINSTNYEYWYNKGLSFSNMDRDEEAIQCFEKTIELNPGNAEAWNVKGICLGSLGRYEQAIKCWNEALELNPELDMAWFNIGFSQEKLGMFKEAVTSFTKFLSIANPENRTAIETAKERLRELTDEREGVDYWYNKAAALCKQRKLEEAVRCFDKVLEQNSEHEDALYYKGLCLMELRTSGDAIDCFDRVLEINPKRIEAWIEKGLYFDNMHLDKAALSCFQEALDIDPQNPVALFGKAVAIDQIDDYGKEGKISFYKKFLDVASSEQGRMIERAKQRISQLESK